ncbi:hypothetical protein B7L09_07900 [Pseudomonas mandelii]|nr:hypothetical protein B7L09_07900 [Pseudomonas mandelii]
MAADMSQNPPAITGAREALSENDGGDEHLDMLCRRFLIESRMGGSFTITYPEFNVRAVDDLDEESVGSASIHLASFIGLMRMECSGYCLPHRDALTS